MKIARPVHFDPTHYFMHYINTAPGDDLMTSLAETERALVTYIDGLDANKGNFAYAAGKWTVKQVLQHITDTERIMSYRALRFARKDQSVLPGFDENAYADNDYAATLSLNDLKTEFLAVRKATELLFANMNAEVLDFQGVASQVSISPRALGWMLSGHSMHHLNVLNERYV